MILEVLNRRIRKSLDTPNGGEWGLGWAPTLVSVVNAISNTQPILGSCKPARTAEYLKRLKNPILDITSCKYKASLIHVIDYTYRAAGRPANTGTADIPLSTNTVDVKNTSYEHGCVKDIASSMYQLWQRNELFLRAKADAWTCMTGSSAAYWLYLLTDDPMIHPYLDLAVWFGQLEIYSLANNKEFVCQAMTL